MGRYLLGSAVARRPYVVEELGLHLYCAEEMCYYIFHNLSMINENFLEERFFQFVGEECKLSALADQMRTMQKSGKSTSEVLTVFFKAVHYYGEDEIVQFQKKLEGYRYVHPLVRRKDKADALLARHRYQNAIREYQYILDQPRAGGLGEDFYRRTADNLCAALIRMGFWREAYNRCILSWNRWKKMETAEKICYIAWLRGWDVPDYIDAGIQFEAGKQFERKRAEIREQGSFLKESSYEKEADREAEKEVYSLDALQEYLLTKKEEYRMQSADFL